MNSAKEIARIKFHRKLEAVFACVLAAVFFGGCFWVAQDREAGHHELRTASVIEKVYKPEEQDTTSVLIDKVGTMIDIDLSIPPQYFIKLALKDRDIVKVIGVEEEQFRLLRQGQSVTIDRLIGRSGLVYQEQIVPSDDQSLLPIELLLI